jgi:hypothetical protein
MLEFEFLDVLEAINDMTAFAQFQERRAFPQPAPTLQRARAHPPTRGKIRLSEVFLGHSARPHAAIDSADCARERRRRSNRRYVGETKEFTRPDRTSNDPVAVEGCPSGQANAGTC